MSKRGGKKSLGEVVSSFFTAKQAQPSLSSKTLKISIHLHDKTVLTSENNSLDMDTMSTLIQRLEPYPQTASWQAINRIPGLMWKVCEVNNTVVRKPCYLADNECIVDKISERDFSKHDISSIGFAMVNVVHIKKRGPGMKPSSRASSGNPKIWSSNYPHTFCHFLKEIYEPFAKGEVQMVLENDQFVTEATTILPTAPTSTCSGLRHVIRIQIYPSQSSLIGSRQMW